MSFLRCALNAIAPALIESCGPEAFDEMIEMQSLACGEPRSPDAKERLVDALDWGRSYAALADGNLVGFASAWGFNIPVPGGRVDAAGLTWVGVHPSFRRRGLLKALLAKHFVNTIERGEPVSMLFASEPEIYSRFGYGVAGRAVSLKLPRAAKLRHVPGSDQVAIELATATYENHGNTVKQLVEAAGQGPFARPGWTTPPNETELRNFFYNQKERYRSEEVLRIAIAYQDGRPTGYALFQRDNKWEKQTPAGTLAVNQLVALTPASYHRLWSVLLNMDLVAKVVAGQRPLDDEVLALLGNPRQASGSVLDTLHVRILDLPAALMARSYAVPIDVVLKVTDKYLPANDGYWRLAAGPGTETLVSRLSGARADLELDVRDLGAIYLGGPSLAWLAAAGLVKEHTPGAAMQVSKAFRSPIEPSTPYFW